jgi:hypothetical protein
VLPEKFTPEFEREQNYFGNTFDEDRFIDRFAEGYAEDIGRPGWKRDIAYEAGLELSRITNSLAGRIGEGAGNDLGSVDAALEEMFEETKREASPEAIERRAREVVERGRLVPGATYETALRTETLEVADRLVPKMILINALRRRRELEKMSTGELIGTMMAIEDELFRQEKMEELIKSAKVPDYVPSGLDPSSSSESGRHPDAPPPGATGPAEPETHASPGDAIIAALNKVIDTMRGDDMGAK